MLSRGSYVLEWPINRAVSKELGKSSSLSLFLDSSRWVNTADKPKCFMTWINIAVELVKMTVISSQCIDQNAIQLFNNSACLCPGDVLVC